MKCETCEYKTDYRHSGKWCCWFTDTGVTECDKYSDNDEVKNRQTNTTGN